ncbi:MAG: TonB-dependent receptor [Pseudomonadota bacterium]
MTKLATYRVKRRLLGASMLTGFAAIAAAPAQAQDDPVADDSIIVTGTRIQRADLEAPSPVQSIGEEAFTLRNSVNVDSLLQELPQVQASNTNISNNPGSGTASVDLRGIGPNRTLVLMDGRRLPNAGLNPTSTAANAVDLNMIPSGLIERVDVVTGGASAVYGSDAIAGVVNFVLKDDFEGIQLDTSYQFREEDTNGGLFNVSFLAGGNFGDGRGNAVVHLGFTDRQGIFAGEIDNSTTSALILNGGLEARGFSDDVPRFNISPIGSTSIPGLHLDQLVDLTAAGLASPSGSGAARTCTDLGTTYDMTNDICVGEIDFIGNTPSIFVSGGAGNEQYNFAAVNFAQIPQQRWQGSAFVTYDINDHIEVYSRSLFSFNEVNQQLAPTPFSSSGGAVTINLDNPFLPAGTVDILNNAVAFDADGNAISAVGDADGNGTPDIQTTIGRRMLETGARFRSVRRTTFQQLIGARGEIEKFGWDWDISYSFGRTDVAIQENGNVVDTNIQEAVNVVPGLNGPVCASGNSACVPIDIFGENRVSPAGAQFVGFDAQRQQVTDQSVLQATLAGDTPVFVPWTETAPAWVFGFEYREESGEQVSDTALATGNVSGFNGSPNVQGRFDVYELFGEVQLPLVEDVVFAEDFTINAAARYSDYSTVESVWTYTGGFSWEPGFNSGLRIRGQYQKAVRAPSLSELFAPQANGFPAATDPCSNSTGDRATCIGTGVPGGLVGSALLAGNSQVETISGGNPDLMEETAETFTIGAVWQPDFLDGLTLTVDYFDIEIEDIIASLGGGSTQNVLDACFITTRDLSSPFCQAVNRLPNGTINNVTTQNENISVATTRGIDIQAAYDIDFAESFGTGDIGILSLNLNGTYLLEKSFIADEVTPLVECAGFFGNACFNNNDPQPTWAHNMNATWSFGPASLRTTWRYIGGTDNVDTMAATSNKAGSISSYSYLDLAGTYDVHEHVTINAGVLNLLDREPPLVGFFDSDNVNTLESTYDILGRQYFIGASFRF